MLSFPERSTSTLLDSECFKEISECSTSTSTLHERPSTSATLPPENISLGPRPVQMDDLGNSFI